jgi:hypothetical protein
LGVNHCTQGRFNSEKRERTGISVYEIFIRRVCTG